MLLTTHQVKPDVSDPIQVKALFLMRLNLHSIRHYISSSMSLGSWILHTLQYPTLPQTNRFKQGGRGRIICLMTSLVVALKLGYEPYAASKVAVEGMLDSFIPNRSTMDFDYAHYKLTEAKKGKENPMASSPSKEAYRKHLADIFNMNRSRILAFKKKSPAPTDAIPNNCSTE
ncbi:hypothetical protein L1887_05177 [Cichorium endivia]|nr:hypothetical protein L1887_05177 [Cichorium endivia]